MLDISTAKLVKKAIDDHFKKEVISLESVCRMQPIEVNMRSDGYTILAIQHGDLTIMVWIQIGDVGTIVRAVKTQAW
ncbi:MAG: hypothetical protein IKK84_04830 [Clostridia bacterium]|nr:hypothetical protein [Clostridia bacterium]